MARTKARSTGDWMSLSACMAYYTIATPANVTTELIRGGVDSLEFMTDLHKVAYGTVYSLPYLFTCLRPEDNFSFSCSARYLTTCALATGSSSSNCDMI